MSRWKIELLIIGFILLIGTVSADVILPGSFAITSSADSDSHNGWLVANGVDLTTITITVSANPILVSLSVDPVYGKVSATDLVTGSSGTVTATFTANKTSIMNLPLNITASNSTHSVSITKMLNIDHDQAYYAYFDYKDEVVVDQTTPFIVTLKDYWGNRVDNKNTNKIHTAKFHIYPPPGGFGTGGLKNATTGYLPAISDKTDSTGNISLTAKVDTVAGENNIWMERIESIPDKYPFIVGITQAPPYFIDSVVTPSGDPGIPADATAVFTIIYTMRDKFRNPAANQTARIFTSDNESIGSIKSNSMGQIWITYGPKSGSGEFNITAVAIENTTVSCSDIVKFYSTDPVSMVVTANPQMMPSRDVPGSQPALIYAKIMDTMGNAVEGEAVTFTLTGYTNSTILTTRPSFSSGTYTTTNNSITISDGNANVTLYPGEFPISGSKYSSNATGTATILATWMGKSMPITVTFKNYPYLRVETSVNPQTVNVTDTFDVDIKLIGDGWKLRAKPIDVILLLDQSGSMGSSTDTNSRLYKAKQAAKVLVDQMNSANGDRVGIITYNQSAWLYQDLTNDLNAAKNKISSISGNTVGAHTNMRRGLYEALKKETSANPGSVRAVIHMTDGDWSMGGDPLARQGSKGFDQYDPSKLHSVWAGNVLDIIDIYQYFPDISGGVYYSGSIANAPNGQTYDDHTTNWNNDQYETTQNRATRTTTYYTNGWTSNQNMSVYASTNQIRLYSLSFVQVPRTNTQNALINMATSTGAFYQHAPDQAALETLYKQIAGELRIVAGVNTQMNLTFQNVNVTFANVTTSMPGKQVFDYNYTRGESTWVTSWNQTNNPLPDQVPKPSYPNVDPDLGTFTRYPYSFDQRNEWQSSSSLNFNAGNISVNQTWETKFRFRVNATGIIEIFGPGSKLVFNNGESVLEMPRTYITAVQNLTNAGINATILDVSNLHSTSPGVIKDFIPLEWDLHYDGNQTVTERISYSYDGGLTWVLFDTNYVTKGTLTDYSSLDVRLLPPGEYWIRVDASAPDAPSDRETIMAPGIAVGTKGRSYIKLE